MGGKGDYIKLSLAGEPGHPRADLSPNVVAFCLSVTAGLPDTIY